MAWLALWRGILPLLAAEFIVWLGFGALLPVMPFYFREHGVDLATLGIVIAAWPAARLVAEPFFGWLADRTARLPLMLGGLAATGLSIALPLVFVGPVAFLVLRALAGLAAAAYDPAARGYLVEATPPERRGEAFGLYGSAQMGGFILGPAIGGLGAALVGGPGFVFLFCGVAAGVAALAVGLWVHEAEAVRRPVPDRHPPPAGVAGLPADELVVAGPAAGLLAEAATGIGGRTVGLRPRSLWNRLLVAAVILQIGAFYAGGTYEVVWSLYLAHLGAGLDFIGLTFAIFGLPVLLLSPVAGRRVDRRGGLPLLAGGALAAALAGTLYTVVPGPVWFAPIVLFEGVGFAGLNPALFAVVAAGSPAGRSSTAQGLFGAAGTIGTILASASAGYLAEVDLRLPFWVFSVVMAGSLLLALAVGWRPLAGLGPTVATPDARPGPAA